MTIIILDLVESSVKSVHGTIKFAIFPGSWMGYSEYKLPINASGLVTFVIKKLE